MSEPPLPRPDDAVRWSLEVRDADSDEVLAAVQPELVLPTASIGKLVLLVEAAHQIATERIDPAEQLSRSADDWVADSGLWYRLATDTLPVTDVCALIGAVSDNLATNVLLRRLGLDTVTATAERIGMQRSRLLDRVRDDRGPEHPPALSVGCATDLAGFCAGLHRREILSPGISERVSGWLAANTDLSMVANAFGLDPLAHTDPDRGIVLWNKTGTTSNVRADTGVVSGPARTVAYAAIAEWSDGAEPSVRDHVLRAMNALGTWLREVVTDDRGVSTQ
ncbi:class A beta-lactamase-related serine hydrolase [Mumia sp. zg.B17]|uniref:serine hydrolase n=1 Tax=Mumia sp. zg.B17 TaxID=2855446 RepID=UPI001C6E7509|nr:serine hydrolase [Mumia sp. zg.B17]MBW9205399.1 class A beta-lactamase-related serine hydrolase [Mumia sp. zg.B17]